MKYQGTYIGCSTKLANAKKGVKMDIRQKIGLGIMGPLFAIAVGHTIVNKINSNVENTNNTECIDDTLRQMSLSETAQFHAKYARII